ncbi:YdeI/OmpD-associated family protein [Candidatus Nomurabacteria bacterium]|nr:YdeI/OmpD-associated family protein [Candidatus Nomurabacteria bacterium]
MIKKGIGMVHKIPKDLLGAVTALLKALSEWEDITPLARNEWICWVESARKIETRERRIRIAKENLAKGKRRPCCWAGCPHR